MAGEWDPEWNSTWEDEAALRERRGTVSPDWGSPRADLCNYRRGYPGKVEPDSEEMPNLQFYQNQCPFKPNGLRIEAVLKEWRGDYARLEQNHSYIQWLFPLREKGVNPYAVPLTLREIKALRADPDAMKRFCKAYRLMLDFYGIELRDEDSGEVARAPNYKERFSNLNRRGHNNLRITRILKCLGELGYGRFQAPLVRFFLEETLVHKELPNVRHSALDYFMFTVRDREQRKELVLFAWEHFPDKGRFIWGPRDLLRRRAERGSENHGATNVGQEREQVARVAVGKEAGSHGNLASDRKGREHYGKETRDKDEGIRGRRNGESLDVKDERDREQKKGKIEFLECLPCTGGKRGKHLHKKDIGGQEGHLSVKGGREGSFRDRLTGKSTAKKKQKKPWR
ncbi:opioid growth factor receptor-like [Xenopus tropicalis]|uniref:Opioid growth factor receptor-like n=1 Tax=Xenopus tropicalis TaxID=8364 RepID=A0A803JHL8_XENTR|nr:opioid growth factor receptor-like [Xenopus tropicalis]